jgi:hypothetical protein
VLQHHVEVQEVPPHPPVENDVQLGPEDSRQAEVTTLRVSHQGREGDGRDFDLLPDQVDGVGAALLDLDGTVPAELFHEVVEIGRLIDAEVHIAARAVGRRTPDGLAADHEPVRKLVDGL